MPAIANALGFLDCRPIVVGPQPRDVVISVEEFRGRLLAFEDGRAIREELCVEALLDFLHKHIFGCSLADRPQATVVHAACLRRNGRQLLLAGAKEAGKSTLTLKLAQAGFEIEGDEHVFVEDGRVVARPRACRVKEAAVAYLPELAEVILGSPSYRNFDGQRIFNVDPHAFGSEWRIEEGTVDCIFALKPNHGGYSSIRPMSPSALVQFLLTETGWREYDRGRAVGDLVKLASNVRGIDLSLGDHATAIRCIDLAMDE